MMLYCPFSEGGHNGRKGHYHVKTGGAEAVTHYKEGIRRDFKAEVCLHCGERLYTPEIITRFEEIRKKLKVGKIEDFIEVGKSYQVAGC